VSIDTRTLNPGDVFFAIRGDNRDGHDFIEPALARGAAAVVIDEAHAPDLGEAGPFLVVPDVLEAMRAAGRAARARSKARIVAVTGSVGKTGTKEALKLALGGQAPTHASAASYNNHWGVPLSLARMPREARYGVFEIGMSAAGEIAPLVEMVRPHAAIVTTVAPVHLEFFPSVDAIADEKSQIFTGLEAGGAAIINRDNAYFERQLMHAMASPAGRIITFGEHEKADVRLVQARIEADHSAVEASVFGRPITYRLGAPGRHVVLNSLAVLAAVQALGGDITLAGLLFGTLAPPEGRGARSEHSILGGTFMLIDESYNANPASMRAVLNTLGAMKGATKGRRIAVLADMLELGPEGPALHAGLAQSIEDNEIDLVFAAGPLMQHLWRALPEGRKGTYAAAPSELESTLIQELKAGDVIMIKGSNGTRVSRLVSALKAWFPAIRDQTILQA
jgi:UDP-N-acetylmuramoyl-tripeptide--D-alanyl-D-alanine ligase